MRDAAELREELRPALLHQPGELVGVVGEVEERAGGGELLPLEEHRRARRRAAAARSSPCSGPGSVRRWSRSPSRRVRDLVVVLQVGDERRRGRSNVGVPRRFFWPAVALALEEQAPLDGRDELLGRAEVVAVIPLGAARSGRRSAAWWKSSFQMHVEPVAPLLRGPDQPACPAARSRRPGGSTAAAPAATARACRGQLGQDVVGRVVAGSPASRRAGGRRGGTRRPSSRRSPATNSRTGPQSSPSKFRASPHSVLSRSLVVVVRELLEDSCRRARGGCRPRRAARPGPSAWARSTNRRKSSGVP